MTNKWRKSGKSDRFFFPLGSEINAHSDYTHEIKRCLFLGRKVMIHIDNILKSRDIILSTKVPIVKAVVFSSSHIHMWELDHDEGWAPKNWCFQIESSLDSKRIKQVNPTGNQPWIFTGRTDAEAPILWPPAVTSGLVGKDPDAGKDWGQEEKWATEDEMVGWMTFQSPS